MIKISVREVTSKGMDLHRSIPKEGLGLSDEEIDLRSPIKVDVHLQRAGNMISAATHIKADFGFLCARCLEELHEDQERHYHFHFDVTPKDEYIDLGEEIRQELIIDNPAKVLCKQDCLGLCPTCGVNLNKEKCRCS